MFLDKVKDLGAAVEPWVTTAAIIVAGIWSYLLFVRRRQKYPRASVTHEVQTFPLGEDRLLLRLAVRIENKGEVLLQVRQGRAWVQQVLPCDGELPPLVDTLPELNWPRISDVREFTRASLDEIEPGETETFHFDFVITSAQVVLVYSHLDNVSKAGRTIGWNTTTTHTLAPEGHDDGRTTRTGQAATAKTASGSTAATKTSRAAPTTSAITASAKEVTHEDPENQAGITKASPTHKAAD